MVSREAFSLITSFVTLVQTHSMTLMRFAGGLNKKVKPHSHDSLDLIVNIANRGH